MEALNDNCETMNDQIIQLEEERDSSISMVEELKNSSKTIDQTIEHNEVCEFTTCWSALFRQFWDLSFVGP